MVINQSNKQTDRASLCFQRARYLGPVFLLGGTSGCSPCGKWSEVSSRSEHRGVRGEVCVEGVEEEGEGFWGSTVLEKAVALGL